MEHLHGNLGMVIEWWGRVDPEREAIVFQDQRITYREVNQAVNRIANCLQTRFGIRKGDRVACFSENCVEYYEIAFACCKLGAVFVPLNAFMLRHELQNITGSCMPRVIFSSSAKVDILKSMKDSTPYVEHVFVIGSEGYHKALAASDPSEPDNQADWSSIFAVLFTSGTTGLPKGSILTQANVRDYSFQYDVCFGYGDDERNLLPLPLCFTGALVAASMPIFHAGGTIVLEQKFVAKRFLELINKEKITRLTIVPTLFKRLSEAPGFAEADFSHLRQCVTSGATIPDCLIEAYEKRGVGILRQYGLTEAAGAVMFQPAHLKEEKGAYLPCIWNQVRVVDAYGRDVAPDEPGEIIIRGPTVMAGYWYNKEDTEAALRDGWLYTGDLGAVDTQGYFRILGRKKEIIISGGLNVYSSEVEAVLSNYPGVSEVAVIGLPHPDYGEAVAAVIMPEAGETLDLQAIINFCRSRLSHYKSPKAVFFQKELPHNNVGKIVKTPLIERYRNYFLDSDMQTV